MVLKKLRKVGRLQSQYSQITQKLLIHLSLTFGSEIHKRNFATFSKKWTLCYLYGPLREKCPYSEFVQSVFSRIRTEYGEMRSISPYLVQTRENRNQNNSRYGHFLRGVRKHLHKLIRAFILLYKLLGAPQASLLGPVFFVLFNFVLQICLILYLNAYACNIQMIPRSILIPK